MYSERNFITRKEDKQESKGYSIRYILKKDRLNKIGYDSKNEIVLYIFITCPGLKSSIIIRLVKFHLLKHIISNSYQVFFKRIITISFHFQ